MKKFEGYPEWTTSFMRYGCFKDISLLTDLNDWQDWPSLSQLQSLLKPNTINSQLKPVKFVNQETESEYNDVSYENYIVNTGKVPTRLKSWHDTFGAISWSLFPKSKATIYRLHNTEAINSETKQRSPHRNTLTQFDECGVVILTKNTELVRALKNHDWNTAFLKLRSCWFQNSPEGVVPYIFGHANYEMLTKPFIGLTGKMLVINEWIDHAQHPLSTQYEFIDNKLNTMLLDGFLKDSGQLTPLPLLGVPGWYHENESIDFYRNTQYFRPKRQVKS